MKFAWIENGKIRDIAHDDPAAIYHPDVAAYYTTQVPDTAENGDLWDGVNATKPTPPKPVTPPKLWQQAGFRSAMTLTEKVKWDNNSTPEVVTVKNELPANQEKAQELVDFLVSSNVISEVTASKIMS